MGWGIDPTFTGLVNVTFGAAPITVGVLLKKAFD